VRCHEHEQCCEKKRVFGFHIFEAVFVSAEAATSGALPPLLTCKELWLRLLPIPFAREKRQAN